MNSQLIRMEASFNGYAEGIALDSHGHVSEGSGMNVFLAHDGVLYTPPLATSILPGITRDTVAKWPKTSAFPSKKPSSARDALRRRRSFLRRHSGRNHADPQRGPHSGRQRRRRPYYA